MTGEDRPVDPEISSAATSIFREMVDDLILTSAIEAHRAIKRGRVKCGVCGKMCRDHQPLYADNGLRIEKNGSSSTRPTSPNPPVPSSSSSSDSRSGGYKTGPEKGTGGSTGVGSGSGRPDGNGNLMFDCLLCQRPIASTRYAPHLATCLGFNGSTRRAAARSAVTKARLGASDRGSMSPYVQGSENGDSDNESTTTKRSKKTNGYTKRAKSPTKATGMKRSKTSSGISTPINLPHSRPTLPPSKLGRPPTSIHSAPGGSPEPPSTISATSAGDTILNPIELPGDRGRKSGADSDSSEGADDY